MRRTTLMWGKEFNISLVIYNVCDGCEYIITHYNQPVHYTVSTVLHPWEKPLKLTRLQASLYRRNKLI